MTPTTTSRQKFITAVAWLLALTAMGGSWVHGVEWVDTHGPGGKWAGYLATLPEIGVLLSILKLMDDRRHRVAWLIAGSSVGFTLWANGASAEPGVSGMVVALWPAYMALLALGMTHVNTPSVVEPVQEIPVDPPGEEISEPSEVEKDAAPEPPEPPVVPVVPVGDIGEAAQRRAWVAEQVWGAKTYAEKVAAIRERWGVSEATAKRDLRAAEKVSA